MGSLIRPRADDWNTIAAFANEFNAARRGHPVPGRPPAGIVLLRNDTASHISRYGVTGLATSIIEPSVEFAAFAGQVGLRGVVPAEEHAIGRIAILQEPIAPGAVGRAVACGPTVCRVRMTDESHRYAAPEAGNTGFLVSAELGPVALLSIQPPASRDPQNPELAWCYGIVGAVGAPDELYYVGGYFTGAGSILAHSVALANASVWHSRNTEEVIVRHDIIHDFAVWNGDLYAVGDFQVNPHLNAFGQLVYDTIHFARWDGSEWVDVADGFNNLVLHQAYTLLAYGNVLLIGGSGSNAGIWRFDGSSYSPWSGGPNFICYKLYDWQVTVYAGGEGGFGDGGFYSWSGSQWDLVANGLARSSGASGIVHAVEEFRGKLYLGGQFDYAGGWGNILTRNICAWDGSSYSAVGESGFGQFTDSRVRTLRSYAGRLWIGGKLLSPGSTFAIFDGRALSAARTQIIHHSAGGNAPTPEVLALEIFTDPASGQERLACGGLFHYAIEAEIGQEIERVARYDAVAEAFEKYSTEGLDDRVRDLVSIGTRNFAVGFFQKSGTTDCRYFAELIGGNWQQVGELPGRAWCACEATIGGAPGILLGGKDWLRWYDGSTPSEVISVTGAVYRCRVISNGDLVIVGDFTEVGGVTCHGVARLSCSGGAWSVIALADQGGANCHDVASDAIYLYVVGPFTTIGNANGAVSANRVARMELATQVWSAMGSGLSATVGAGNAIEAYDGKVYVSTRTGLRQWSGSSWLAFGNFSGLTITRGPEMLRAINGLLYIDHEGGAVRRIRLVAYDAVANTFTIIGAGITQDQKKAVFDAPIHATTLWDTGQGDEMHVGGDFTRIGDDGGDLSWPRNCLFTCDAGQRTRSFLGGVGHKKITAAIDGTADWCSVLRALPVPGLSGQTLCAGGHFTVASNVEAGGIAAVSSRRGFIPVGRGVHYGSANGEKAYVGVKAGILGSDGYHYFVGLFDEARNDLAKVPSAALRVPSPGVIAWDGQGFESLDDGTELFSQGYAIVEFGEPAEGRARIWIVHDGEERVAEWDPATQAWIKRGANLDTSQTLIEKLVVFDGQLWAVGYITIMNDGSYFAARYTGGGNWVGEVLPEPNITQITDGVAADLDGTGTKLYVCCAVQEAANCVFARSAAGGWSVVGPSGTGPGALHGAAYGIAFVGFGEGDKRLLVAGGNLQGYNNDLMLASFDPDTGLWTGHGRRGLTGIIRGVDAPRANKLALPLGETLVVETENPDVGDVRIDGIGEWNPSDGWRRIQDKFGVNEVTLSAFD